MKKYFKLLLSVAFLIAGMMSYAQTVDYSVISVKEEASYTFTKMTSDNDYVCMPQVKRSGTKLSWLTNRIIDISPNGSQLAYVSLRNNSTNIFIKDLDKLGTSVQRTNRNSVLDFSYSPNGKYIVFSEQAGKFNQIYQTDASKGYICRQITTGNSDYTPVYSADMKQIYFTRMERNGTSIWSYDMTSNFLASYTRGYNPCSLGNSEIYCVRQNATGNNEIWKVNYKTSVEECIVSDTRRDFSTPSISPDGNWLLFVGSSQIPFGNSTYVNTDIYVCRTDGSQLTQMTYHAADDLSPVWSKDGKYIYFISQRGSTTGTANIWRMNFLYE